MHLKVGRVAAKLMHSLAAAVGSKVGKEAEELCASGQCAAAAVALMLAVDLGHLPSRALLAHMMLDGREGVAKDWNAAFELVEEGARLGCHDCQGVIAKCFHCGLGCEEDNAQSMELAFESSRKGSRYGQHALGELFNVEDVGDARAVAFFRLAAAQNHANAQYSLGCMYDHGCGVDQDSAEALRLWQLAAAQGLPWALYRIAVCHEKGRGGVRKNKAEAICLYRRAQALGVHAAADLQRLDA
jgi:uncharacterized protein